MGSVNFEARAVYLSTTPEVIHRDHIGTPNKSVPSMWPQALFGMLHCSIRHLHASVVVPMKVIEMTFHSMETYAFDVYRPVSAYTSIINDAVLL